MDVISDEITIVSVDVVISLNCSSVFLVLHAIAWLASGTACWTAFCLLSVECLVAVGGSRMVVHCVGIL